MAGNEPPPPGMLPRGFSMVAENQHLVNQTRSRALDVFEEEEESNSLDVVTDYSFRLPNFETIRIELRSFIEKELVDTHANVSMQKAQLLNWWLDFNEEISNKCPKLWPIATNGDGNCLLHAASLALWGLHDRLLILRHALYESTRHHDTELFLRWRAATAAQQAAVGVDMQESEWRREWAEVRQLADPSRSQTGTTGDRYSWLEPIHVLALAHTLKRPIIVLADAVVRDVNNEPLQPQTIAGIYLPLLEPNIHCRRPLLLTYYSAHYSALCPVRAPPDKEEMMPLLDTASCELLPVRFASPEQGVEPKRSETLDFYRRYLDIEWLTLDVEKTSGPVCPPLCCFSRRINSDLVLEPESSVPKRPPSEWHLQFARRVRSRWKNSKVPCVMLDSRLPDGYDEMISNYLHDAGNRQSMNDIAAPNSCYCTTRV